MENTTFYIEIGQQLVSKSLVDLFEYVFLGYFTRGSGQGERDNRTRWDENDFILSTVLLSFEIS